MYLRLLSLLLLATCRTVYGQFSTGATAVECETLLPAGFTPATGTPPFIVAVTSPNYTPNGNAVTVFIASADTVVASGLVVQARRTSGLSDNTPFGSFNVPTGGNYQLLECGTSTGGTITNTNSNDKTLPLSFMWNPPEQNVGSVEFIVSLVDTNGQFWSNVVSTGSIPSTAGELTALSIEQCPIPLINNDVATWTAPNCFRGTVAQNSRATCTPPSGSTFPVGTSTINCVCSDRGESDGCDITLTIISADACNPNPCNSGTCIPVSALPSGFFCQCPAGLPQPTCTPVGNTAPNNPVCPPTQTATALFGSNSAAVVYDLVQCNDVEDGTITANCVSPSGSPFNVGSTSVECTCTDTGGLTANCFFTVTVNQGGIPGGVCDGNPCSGNECRVSASSLAGYTCHSVTGTPCQQL